MIVAVRGAPGAGKTTALEEIRQRTGAACIDVDTVWAMLGGAPWTTPGAYDLALGASARLAVTFHARWNGGGHVFVASPFDAEHLATFARMLAARIASVALVVDDDVLRARLGARPAGHYRDAKEALRLNEELRRGEGGVVDVTHLAPEHVAERVLRAVT